MYNIRYKHELTDKMKRDNVIMRKYIGIILYILILLVLPLKWYTSVYRTLEGYPSYYGYSIIMKNNFQYINVFILCLFIQFLIIRIPEYSWFGVVSQIIYIMTILHYPAVLYNLSYDVIKVVNGSHYQMWKEIFLPTYDVGFYISLILSIIVIVQNIWSRLFFNRKMT